jgi:hypothetical protein
MQSMYFYLFLRCLYGFFIFTSSQTADWGLFYTIHIEVENRKEAFPLALMNLSSRGSQAEFLNPEDYNSKLGELEFMAPAFLS